MSDEDVLTKRSALFLLGTILKAHELELFKQVRESYSNFDVMYQNSKASSSTLDAVC